MTTSTVRDNAEAARFELETEGAVAIAAYERRGEVIAFTHTVVPPELEGRGVGGRLIGGALDDVRRRGLKVAPLCSFVQRYMKTHPETQDLIAQD